jgi:hypothetical protein
MRIVFKHCAIVAGGTVILLAMSIILSVTGDNFLHRLIDKIVFIGAVALKLFLNDDEIGAFIHQKTIEFFIISSMTSFTIYYISAMFILLLLRNFRKVR